MSLWGELKRRNVVRVAVAYAIASWLLAQVAGLVFPAFGAPPWVLPVLFSLLAMGFVVALVLSWVYEITPEGIKQTDSVSPAGSITRATGRKLDFVIITCMALAIGYLVVENYFLDAGDLETVESAAIPVAAEASAIEPRATTREVLPNSVAVLPLENLSPDPDKAYIAAGLHEEILNQLAKLSNLSVTARTSVLRYGEDRPPIAEIAEMLNVQAIMEGSVRYAGNRIRVTTQLIDARTAAHLWSETYEREFDDVFAIESDIAMNVANALQAEFSVDEQARIERRSTRSALAYDLFLEARSLTFVGEQAGRMQELLDKAIEIDPDFAAAYGAKAFFYASVLVNTTVGSSRDRAELEPLIQESVEKALALDPEDVWALSAQAVAAMRWWRWTEAAAAISRVYELTGSSVLSPTWFRSWSGNEAEAIRVAAREVVLNPLASDAYLTQGIVLAYAKDYAAAAAAFHEAIALEPTSSSLHSWLAVAELAFGDTDEATEELRLAEQLLGPNRSMIVLLDAAYCYGRLGDAANARRLFTEISEAVNRGAEIGAGGRALAHLAVGDYEEALEWLRRGAEKAKRHELDAGFYSLMNLKLNYTNDPALERPDFVEVRARLRGD